VSNGYLAISPLSVPGIPALPPLNILDFQLKAAHGQITIELNPNAVSAHPPTPAAPGLPALSGWWLDPTTAQPGGLADLNGTLYVQRLNILDPTWLAAIAPQTTIDIKFQVLNGSFCNKLTVQCGPTNTVSCDDWSTLTPQQSASVLASTLYVSLPPFRYSSSTALPTGSFDATVLCNGGLEEKLALGPLHAFLLSTAAGPPPGPGIRSVTLQLKQSSPPAATTTLKGACSVKPNTYYERQLNADVTAANAFAPERPVLIISYARTNFFAPWLLQCNDYSPVRQAVQFGYVDEPAICILGEHHRRKSTGLGHPYFPPGVPLIVYVIHEPRVDAAVTASQVQGLTSLQVLPGTGAVTITSAAQSNNSLSSLANGSSMRAPKRTDGDDCILDRYELAPRASGPFTVLSDLLDEKGAVVPGSPRSLEMLIDQSYIGAVRLGVAFSFSTYGSRSFGVHQSANGGSAIYQDSYSPAAFELLAGYTAFLPTRYASEVRCSIWDCPVPSPFFGIGVVSATPTGTFNVLTSAYVGAEVQMGPLTLQLLPIGVRRDTVLADGFRVGTPVPATATVPTTTKLHYAPAFALTVDGDIFKIAGATLP
jgi:hypothetical protein